MRLIDADALRRRMYHEAFETNTDLQRWDSGCWIRYKMFENAIENAPTIEPERKKGKWIDYTEDGFVECPYCHSATNCDGNKDELHFCFSCGADMRGEQE